MDNIQKLLGDEWVKREVLCAEPRHPLGRWHRKSPDNPIARYTEELLGFILNGGLKCDLGRLATKLSGEFVETLVEIGYAVFLAKQGFDVRMEPTAPKSGPDLLAVRENEYYIEIRKVGLDEAREEADLATSDIFKRLCSKPSRYALLISATKEYAAHFRQLKQAVKTVAAALEDLTKRHMQKATLYYFGPGDYLLCEGDEKQPEFDYTDGKKLAAQLQRFEKLKGARFVCRFEDTGNENSQTWVAVQPLGEDPHLVKPDETHQRLKDILWKKSKEQLPKASRGIVLLEITDLQKLMVDEETIMRAVYGDLLLVVKKAGGEEEFDTDLNRKPNGFFQKTTRVSAVVAEVAKIDGAYCVHRPSNQTPRKLVCWGGTW